ncbi:extracellular solute-binding protein family 1 [Caldalkalibacillus thermarum TA2.A1]|uniref:Extracellular solute-binding protein n=1 Tax=Caldalkalibacillus thermarum (strain TA2.A1) TaxID=986075 RepID=F5L7P0_CALTT|nr:extracellular solute-binding protein [Caldalkalibacillus thermarum]EGL82616.1 extracellular solute-binding protein family 1 [Caldalkalibacillus thermarum TA2.A1]QZT33328.1 extracellular solute-binding protein [Caldalkalibacillus thermarum TA2.A1]
MKHHLKPFLFALLALSLLFALAACGQTDDAEQPEATQPEEGQEDAIEENNEEAVELSGELVVYSARNEKFVQPLLDKFAEETGITVRALHGDDGTVQRIIEEANNVQADIFISNDIGAMEYLRLQGLLEGWEPKGVESIDEKFRAEDNSWIGLSARSRGFIYNKDLISEEEMPKTMEELADPKWAGQFMITRGGNGSMVAHVSALRYEWGDEKTKEWLSKVKDNAGAITEGHGDIRRAVGAGEYKFGLVNNYYYHQQLNEPEDNNVGFIYPDQGEGEMGVFVNAAGVALIKGGPNPDNAKAFIEWLLTEEGQREFSYESMEVPLNPNVQTREEAARISDYKVMDMPLRELGKVWEDTRALIEEAGLDLELR